MLGQAFANLVNHRIGLVSGLRDLSDAPIFFSVGLGVLDHALDLRLVEARVGLDRDFVFLPAGFVLGRHVQDAVGIDIKGHFDLRRTTRGLGDALEVELTEQFVARSDLAFTLEDLDRDGGLIIVRGRKHLSVLGRDRRVLVNHFGHHATEGLDPQGQWRDVKQEHILALAGQHRTLNRSADRHRLIGVDVLAWFFAKEFFDLFLHLGHPGHTADQNDVLNVADFDASVFDRDPTRFNRALNQFIDQRLEFGPGQFHVEVTRPRSVCGDIGQIDFGLSRTRELNFGLLGSFFQALQCQHIARQIDTRLFLEFTDDVFDQALIEIFSAQKSIAIGGKHFELFLAIDVGNLDDRNIEGAAPQVKHGDLAIMFGLFVEPERQGCSRRLIDDALDFKPCDPTGVFSGLALGVIEIRWNRDDCFSDVFTKIVLGGLFHFAQYFGRHLRGCQLATTRLDPGVAVVRLDDRVGHQIDVLLHFFFGKLAADQSLDRKQGVGWIRHSLTLGGCAHKDLAVLHVRNNGGRSAGALGIFNHTRLTAFHDGDAGIGGAEVDTDDLGHGLVLLE